jgi:hypothetical protein
MRTTTEPRQPERLLARMTSFSTVGPETVPASVAFAEPRPKLYGLKAIWSPSAPTS